MDFVPSCSQNRPPFPLMLGYWRQQLFAPRRSFQVIWQPGQEEDFAAIRLMCDVNNRPQNWQTTAHIRAIKSPGWTREQQLMHLQDTRRSNCWNGSFYMNQLELSTFTPHRLCVGLLLPCWMVIFWPPLGFSQTSARHLKHSDLGNGLCFCVSLQHHVELLVMPLR